MLSLGLALHSFTHCSFLPLPHCRELSIRMSLWSHTEAEACKNSNDAYCGSPATTQSIFGDNDLMGQARDLTWDPRASSLSNRRDIPN